MDKITIIGGLRKWFQPIADELKFELIHNGGDSPDRIMHDLKRSKAMFMVLTATSHKATYKCVEYAKAHNIPFYKLRGSKSQLRELILKLEKEI